MNGKGLKSKAVKGVIWTAISKFSVQGLLLLTTAILARLLMPEDFGIIGMAAIITVAIGIVTDQGLAAAIIQKKELNDLHLSSTFWAGIALGCLLFILGVTGSKFMAAYYRNAAVGPVVRVLSLGFVIGSIGMVHKAQLKRYLDFRRLAIIEIYGVLANAVISIGFAFSGFGVWSIVWGLLARSIIVTIFLWLKVSWRPQILFHWDSFKELFSFSANVLGNDIVIYINSNVPYVVIGRILGSTILGFFTIAFNLVTLPIYSFAAIVSKVAFPTFSRVQDDLSAIQHGYTKSLTFISSITFPLLAGLMVVAPEFVFVVFGGKWSEAVLPVQILCPMALLRSVGTTRGALFQARGRSDIELKWNCCYFIPLCIAAYWGSRQGLIEATAAITTLFIIAFPIIQYITNRLIQLDSKRYLKSLAPTAVSTIMMALVVSVVRTILLMHADLSNFMLLVVCIITGAIVYYLALHSIDKTVMKELFELLVSKKISSTALTQA